jgi:acyl carrier protein
VQRKIEYLSICSSGIAPEVDVAALDGARDLRDQTDCDSVDFLHVVIGLHKELGIEIPDADLAKFTTWNGSVKYLLSKAGKT